MPEDMQRTLDDLRRANVPDDRQARLNLQPADEASVFAVSANGDPNEAAWTETIEIARQRAAAVINFDDPAPRASRRRAGG
jgi:hypothetical protein